MPAKVIDVNLWFKTTTEAMIIRQGERGWPKGSVQGAICQVKVAIYHNHDIWVHQWMILIKKNFSCRKDEGEDLEWKTFPGNEEPILWTTYRKTSIQHPFV